MNVSQPGRAYPEEMDRMADMNGKYCLITGATSGIGEVTALELARMGASVTIIGRSLARCEATTARIKQETGNLTVQYLVADLASMAQVRQAAQQYMEKNNRLDVLVNNAGSVFPIRQLSVDGFEMTIALNHLNYFLLTLLLLEPLKASAPVTGLAARVVNVASDSHRGQHLDFNNLQNKRFYNLLSAYGRSKLANVLFTYELARRISSFKITANALHPGVVATRIWKKGGLLNPLIAAILRPVTITPEQGAQTSIYLACSPDVEGVTGHYFTDCKAVLSDPASYDESVAKRLWDTSLEMVGLTDIAAL
jgi:NAD(P)-dependent dehydrogenase (short-subunit alcohol dehydrogenase family)